MYLEAKKIHLIEKMLKVDSEPILMELESILDSYNSNTAPKLTIDDFVGIISRKEANEMNAAIADTCESIDDNNWK